MLDPILSSWNYLAATVWAALVNALPLTCVVTGAAWLVLERARKWSSTTRYGAWCAVLAFTVLLPLGQAFLPHPAKPLHEERMPMMPPVMAIESSPGMPQVIIAQPASPAAIPNTAPRIIPARLHLSLPVSPVSLFVLFWILAAAFQFVRLAIALRYSLLLKRSAWPAPEALEARWQNLLRTSYHRGRPVELGISNSVSVPAVVGYRRPFVLLPDSTLYRLEDEQLDAILIHELAHVRRYDDWTIAIQRILEALFIWHPLVRLICSKMELQREIACDDWVLSSKKPRAYAFSLTAIAEFCVCSPNSGLMSLAIENPSQLSQRIEILLDTTRSITTRISPRKLGGLVGILGLASILSLQLPDLMAVPIQTSTAKPEKPAPPAPPKPPSSMTEQQKLSCEQAELAKKQAELGRKQAALARQQVEQARREMKQQLQQMKTQIKRQALDQMQTQMMKSLELQLPRIDIDKITKDAMQAQLHMRDMQSKLENMQIRPELKQQLEKLRAKQEQLREEQQRTAQELQRTLNEIFNDTANKNMPNPEH